MAAGGPAAAGAHLPVYPGTFGGPYRRLLVISKTTLLLTVGFSLFFHNLSTDVESDWSPVHDAAFNGRVLELRRLIGQVRTPHHSGDEAQACFIGRSRPLSNQCVFKTKPLVAGLFAGCVCEPEHPGQGVPPPRSLCGGPPGLRRRAHPKGRQRE